MLGKHNTFEPRAKLSTFFTRLASRQKPGKKKRKGEKTQFYIEESLEVLTAAFASNIPSFARKQLLT